MFTSYLRWLGNGSGNSLYPPLPNPLHPPNSVFGLVYRPACIACRIFPSEEHSPLNKYPDICPAERSLWVRADATVDRIPTAAREASVSAGVLRLVPTTEGMGLG
jgi:hypothetical protein